TAPATDRWLARRQSRGSAAQGHRVGRWAASPRRPAPRIGTTHSCRRWRQPTGSGLADNALAIGYTSMATQNRWVIAAAGVLMQLAPGAVYAWSVFRIPLTKAFGWTISEVTLTFTIAIFVLGLAAFAGGLWMRRAGPRTVALTAGLLYGFGVFSASLAGRRLWWLYCSYGLIAGIGLGLGYIVPVATLVKWFPDKRGLITGLAVAGFGAGALITAPIATRLIASVGVLQTFAILGAAYFVAVTGSALLMRNPPEGWMMRNDLKVVPYKAVPA